jgi:hypothetical protein
MADRPVGAVHDRRTHRAAKDSIGDGMAGGRREGPPRRDPRLCARSSPSHRTVPWSMKAVLREGFPPAGAGARTRNIPR